MQLTTQWVLKALLCDSRDAHIGDYTSGRQTGLYTQQETRNYEPKTRQFSNHESRLLLQSHTFAIILDLTPYLLKWYVQSTQGSLCPSPMN